MPIEAWSRIARALGESPAAEDQELARAIGGFINRMPAAIAFVRALPPGWQQRQQQAGIERTRQVVERTRPGPEMER
jgi:hypothetical protein